VSSHFPLERNNMISKPPSNWANEDRTATAAQSAVAVAQYAAGTTKRGFSLLKAVVQTLFAVLWGFAGLAQFAIGGGLGGAAQAGGGIMVMLLAAIPGYFAWRNFRKAFGSDAAPRATGSDSDWQSRAFAKVDAGWRQEGASYQESQASFGFGRNDEAHRPFAQGPATFGAPRGGDRHEVHNSQSQLVKCLLFGVVLIPIGFFVVSAGNPIMKLVGLIIIICGPFVMLKAFRGLVSGSAAFSYDHEGITVPGWFGEKHLAWRDVSEFSIRTLTTYMYGFIKTSTQYSLYALKTGGGKMLLPTQFTGLDVDGLAELAARLELYRLGGADIGARFAPDRAPEYASAAPAPSPAFGRIDNGIISPVPFANRPGPAAAPSFGRQQGTFGNR